MGENEEEPRGRQDVPISPDYLAQLIKDKKQLSLMPSNFIHLQRLIDEEISKVRRSLFQLPNDSSEPIELPEPEGDVVQLQEKLYVPVDEHPEYNFVGRLLGPRGSTAKQLENKTGCKIMIRGKGSMRDKRKEEQNRGKANWEHLNDELHVLITVEDTQNRAELKMRRALEEVKQLLVPIVDGEDELKKRQLMELAIINGTYRDCNYNEALSKMLHEAVYRGANQALVAGADHTPSPGPQLAQQHLDANLSAARHYSAGSHHHHHHHQPPPPHHYHMNGSSGVPSTGSNTPNSIYGPAAGPHAHHHKSKSLHQPPPPLPPNYHAQPHHHPHHNPAGAGLSQAALAAAAAAAAAAQPHLAPLHHHHHHLPLPPPTPEHQLHAHPHHHPHAHQSPAAAAAAAAATAALMGQPPDAGAMIYAQHYHEVQHQYAALAAAAAASQQQHQPPPMLSPADYAAAAAAAVAHTHAHHAAQPPPTGPHPAATAQAVAQAVAAAAAAAAAAANQHHAYQAEMVGEAGVGYQSEAEVVQQPHQHQQPPDQKHEPQQQEHGQQADSSSAEKNNGNDPIECYHECDLESECRHESHIETGQDQQHQATSSDTSNTNDPLNNQPEVSAEPATRLDANQQQVMVAPQ